MKIHSIQYLRGFAALFVLYTHLTFSFFKTNLCGAIGVDLFFVTSGFIISFSVKNITKDSSGAWLFIKKRFRRVYPLYFFMTAAFALILIIHSPDIHRMSVVQNSILSLFFIIPQYRYHDPIIFTGWSLVYEMFFYSFVAGSILIFKGNFAKPLICTLLVLGGIGLFYNFDNLHADFLISPFFLEFSFGFLIHAVLLKYVDNTSKPIIRIWFALSVFLFLAVSLGKDYNYQFKGLPREMILFASSIIYPRAIVWGIPSAFLFVSTILMFKNSGKIKWLEYLGDISYSIYLIQAPLLLVYDHIHVKGGGAKFLLVFVEFAIVILMSSITHYLIERENIFKFIKKLYD